MSKSGTRPQEGIDSVAQMVAEAAREARLECVRELEKMAQRAREAGRFEKDADMRLWNDAGANALESAAAQLREGTPP